MLPLAIATGASAASQNAIGTGVLGGMISATVLAVFFVPVFFVGHDENDLPDEISLKYPVLYQQGQLKASFNEYVFTQWMVRGLIYATITYTLCTWMLRDRVDYHGVPLTLEMVGTTTYWVVITQANVELLIRINNRRPRVVFISVMSILAYYPVMQWYSNTFWKGSGNSFSMQGVGASVLESAVTYQTLGAGVGFYMFVSLFMIFKQNLKWNFSSIRLTFDRSFDS